MPNNLPLNWCVKSFKDSFVSISPAYKVKQKEYNEFGSYPIIDQGEEFIGGYTDSNKGLISDIPIIAFGDHTRRFKYIDFAFIAGADGLKIYKPIYTDVKFSYYQCLSLDFPNKGYARHNALLQKCDFKIPPLAEQERIVAKIEALFAGIDEGVERLKSAQAQIKQYRQSVLKSAFEGKLYKTTEWKEVKLENIISNEKYAMKRGPFGSSLKKEFFVPVGIRVFEQYNPINNDPYWARYFITKEKYKELYAFRAGPGDLLISCSGTLGKILELPADVEEGIINQALLKISLNNKKISNQFFIYWFNSNQTQKLILENVRGAAIQNIASVKELKQISILLPTISEQQHIVAEIENRFAVVDELEKAVNEGLEKADKLKQSILKKAFEGKLAPQNPNDEPASILLERIKKEQKPTKGKKKC